MRRRQMRRQQQTGGSRWNCLRGQYKLTIETEGRKAEYAQPINVEVAGSLTALTLSARGEITVAAAAQAQAATGGEQLSSQAVSELPLNKRDFSSLLLLAAGTMTDTNGATNFTAQLPSTASAAWRRRLRWMEPTSATRRWAAQLSRTSTWTRWRGIDSSSGWMPAEVGRGAAGFTNIHTRSGASGFHGSVFEFVRNSAFDARNYFDHATPAYPGRIPPFRRNEFGFTNGGAGVSAAYV